MGRNKILTRVVKVKDIKKDDFYEEIGREWQYRAERLRLRRWRALKRNDTAAFHN